MKSSPDELAYAKRYYEDHREERATQQATYRTAHREEIAAYSALHYAVHRKEKREKAVRQKRWFVGNLNILKQTQGCDDCGTHDGALLHHHLDPQTKKYSVSQMCGYSLEAFVDEIAKCTVLCDACHKKRHVEMKALVV